MMPESTTRWRRCGILATIVVPLACCCLGCRSLACQQPLRVNIDFGAGVIEQMIERLTVLRLQMLPKPPPARKQN